jgi:hypothetical protein
MTNVIFIINKNPGLLKRRPGIKAILPLPSQPLPSKAIL